MRISDFMFCKILSFQAEDLVNHELRHPHSEIRHPLYRVCSINHRVRNSNSAASFSSAFINCASKGLSAISATIAACAESRDVEGSVRKLWPVNFAKDSREEKFPWTIGLRKQPPQWFRLPCKDTFVQSRSGAR